MRANVRRIKLLTFGPKSEARVIKKRDTSGCVEMSKELMSEFGVDRNLYWVGKTNWEIVLRRISNTARQRILLL